MSMTETPKIFLAKLSLEESLHERIFEVFQTIYNYDLEDGKNPIPSNQRKLTIETLKTQVNIILNDFLKSAELDKALEEKIAPELQIWLNQREKFTARQLLDFIFQKLKSEAFSLPEKELHEKEGE